MAISMYCLLYTSLLVMQKESWYRPIYVIAAIWKESGWGTVVYLATISGLDPSIYEAAAIDGASRFGKIRYITFPLLIPTIVTVFLLNIGNFLELGFDQSFNLLTPMTYSAVSYTHLDVYKRQGVQSDMMPSWKTECNPLWHFRLPCRRWNE